MEINNGFVVVSRETASRLINELIAKRPEELSCEGDLQHMYDGVHFHFRTPPGAFRRYLRGGIPWIAFREVDIGALTGEVWDGTMFGDTDFTDRSSDPA